MKKKKKKKAGSGRLHINSKAERGHFGVLCFWSFVFVLPFFFPHVSAVHVHMFSYVWRNVCARVCRGTQLMLETFRDHRSPYSIRQHLSEELTVGRKDQAP